MQRGEVARAGVAGLVGGVKVGSVQAVCAGGVDVGQRQFALAWRCGGRGRVVDEAVRADNGVVREAAVPREAVGVDAEAIRGFESLPVVFFLLE